MIHLRYLLFLSVWLLPYICSAGKDTKHSLPDVPPEQQWEYIQNLSREAEARMSNYDYTAAQLLLTERSELLDLYYEKNGASDFQQDKTGYEYLSIIPKLYCNLRIGLVETNLKEIAHIREQYQKIFNEQHPQDDLLETEVAETYFRMGNIGMAIETAESMIERLSENSDMSSVAYYRIYHRLMAYYKSIGRTDTRYYQNYYKPENELEGTSDTAGYLHNTTMTFVQKMANVMDNAAKLITDEKYEEARSILQVGMKLLDTEYPEEKRMHDAETMHRYKLIKSQLLSMQTRTYEFFMYGEDGVARCLFDNYELKKELYGDNSTEVADAAQTLGAYYSDYAGNDLDLAIGYYQEAYNILKSSNEYRKGQIIDLLGVLMQCYSRKDDAQKAQNIAKELILSTKDLVMSSFGVSSSAERAALWDKYNHWLLMEIPRVALKFEGRVELGAELYDIALFSKGLLMLSDNAMTELVMKKGSPELKQEGRRLHELRLQLHRALTSSSLPEFSKTDDIRQEIETVEHSLVAKVNKLGNWQHGLEIGWRDIQKHLKKGETAIEFLEFDDVFSKDGGIIALILSADSYCPIMRRLCRIGALNYSSTFIHCQTTIFYDRYWQNIESDLKENKTIFFSPSGVLNTIPIEYCPVNLDESLFDKYNMYRLTSTRKILERDKPKHNISSAYLYGGIDYTPSLSQIIKANVQLIKEGYITNGTSGLDENMSMDSLKYVTYGFYNKPELMGIYNTTLASTLLLDNQLKMMQCKTHTFTDYRATEECFKGMSSKPIDMLYINTHGFTNTRSSDYEGHTYIYKKILVNVSESEMSMTRTGLLLTGASMAYSSSMNRKGLEDGIITAAEIAQLNLRNVKLVFLSACETGLGEITSEGVLGLQRGFKRAGAEALITTLASVTAITSLYFDSTFFTNLMYDSNGKMKKVQSIHDAFTTSVKQLRKAYKEPKFWCVNLLIDALD